MQPLLPEDERALYAKIKEIFDPLGIFNPGIKCVVPPKDLAAELNAWCRLQG